MYKQINNEIDPLFMTSIHHIFQSKNSCPSITVKNFVKNLYIVLTHCYNLDITPTLALIINF